MNWPDENIDIDIDIDFNFDIIRVALHTTPEPDWTEPAADLTWDAPGEDVEWTAIVPIDGLVIRIGPNDCEALERDP